MGYYVLDRDTQYRPISPVSYHIDMDQSDFHLELLHDQLPLAVPCYDLVLVIELTLGDNECRLRVLPTPLT